MAQPGGTLPSGRCEGEQKKMPWFDDLKRRRGALQPVSGAERQRQTEVCRRACKGVGAYALAVSRELAPQLGRITLPPTPAMHPC